MSPALVNQEALKRILFIFAKLNPGIRYVQGMNEVLAPLYYVFKTDVDEVNVVRTISSTSENIIEILLQQYANCCLVAFYFFQI